MKAICTYCSKPKRTDSGDLPAVRRYLSPRIERLYQSAQKSTAAFLILSGQYGLLTPDHPIPWYDHLLEADEVEQMVPTAAGLLTRLGVTSLEYHTADHENNAAVRPYLALARQAAEMAGIKFTLVILAGKPD